jgi:beta-glucosidase
MKKYLFAALILSTVLGCDSNFDFKYEYEISKNEPSFLLDKNIEEKIDVLIAKLSLEEKIGQTCQITLESVLQKNLAGKMIVPHTIDTIKLSEAINTFKIGSILNVANGPEGPTFNREKWKTVINKVQDYAASSSSGIPIIYGVDAIHGATYTSNSTLFPQEIGLAASWNLSHAKIMGEVTAYETRASGIPWNFSPVLDLGRTPIWSRFFETLGEDVYLTKKMGAAIVEGYQGSSKIDDKHVAACLKHYVGYSAPRSGRDRTPALIPNRTMEELYLPPFEEAIKQGALTIMINSGEVNGIPGHRNKYLITDVLKNKWGFAGFTVSDWEDFILLHKVAQTDSSIKQAVASAINAGVDMSMVPNNPEYKKYCKLLIELVNEGAVSEDRINDAVRRILRVKHHLNLFEQPTVNYSSYTDFGSKKHIAKAYRAATESVTLLKNTDNILPLNKNARIMVIGPSANSLSCLNGAWTHTWQGVEEKYHNNHPTIKEAIENEVGEISYFKGSIMSMENGDEVDLPSQDLKAAVNACKNHDVAIVCLGELPSTERPGDIYSLDMALEQRNIIKKLSKTGIPIVLVLVEGRPKIINDIEPLTSAVLQAYLPGDQGGRAVSDILFGEINPSGKLPYTYPRHSGVIMHYDHKQSELINGNTWQNTFFDPQWEFGHGLSYTSFKYSDLKLSKKNMSSDNKDSIVISFIIENTGEKAGKEATLLYLKDHYASITPQLKKLIRFDKVSLQPGQKETLKFVIKNKDLEFYGLENKWASEDGAFSIIIEDLQQSFNLKTL